MKHLAGLLLSQHTFHIQQTSATSQQWPETQRKQEWQPPVANWQWPRGLLQDWYIRDMHLQRERERDMHCSGKHPLHFSTTFFWSIFLPNIELQHLSKHMQWTIAQQERYKNFHNGIQLHINAIASHQLHAWSVTFNFIPIGMLFFFNLLSQSYYVRLFFRQYLFQF